MHAPLLTLIELEFWLSHKLFAVQQNKDGERQEDYKPEQRVRDVL